MDDLGHRPKTMVSYLRIDSLPIEYRNIWILKEMYLFLITMAMMSIVNWWSIQFHIIIQSIHRLNM